MASPLHVRLWNGISIPTPGIFEIDAQHTTIGFVAQHLMVTQVRGRFEEFEGRIHVADDPLDSTATASMRTSSITTGTDDRDTHLKSPDFLDVEEFPTMSYVSRELRGGTGQSPKWTMVNGMMRRRRRDSHGITVFGDLTIKDTTRPIELDVTLDGVTHDPWGGERLALTARGQIDREAYDMTWNVALEAGGWLVSKHIQIEIRAQAIRQS
jgi:polyisoprenoid-binding protein YceI